jgi:hypothetical protein
MATVITIKNTRGEIIADVSSKEILKDIVSVALVGKGVESYIEDFNQNFIKILENLASATPPENPLEGQMWYDLKQGQLKIYDGEDWGLNVLNISGKSLEDIKNWVLGYIDLSDKFNKSGGKINGTLEIGNEFSTSGNIIPTKNEVYDLGSYTNRFRTLYIKEGSIFLGDKGKYHITKFSFIYPVSSDNEDVSKIPTGTIIMNKKTGVAIVKKLNGKFNSKNSKFGQLVYDVNNAVKLGESVLPFQGDKAVFSRGWSCGWGPNNFTFVQISTPMNNKFFGHPRRMSISPIGITGGSRGLWHTGGWPGWQWSSTFEFIIFSTPGNGQYFGNAQYRSVEGQGVSDGVRGVFSGGWNGWWSARNDIEYVTINTPSNSRYFGRAWRGRKYSNTHITDGTKGVNAGGMAHWWWWGRFNDMDYITISTPSNGVRFGGLRWRRWCNEGSTDGIKGFIFGGWWNPKGSIEVIRIATPCNTNYFGNLGNYFSHAATTGNGKKIVVAGGWGYGWCWWRQIRHFNTNSPQNGTYFGNLDRHEHHFDSTSGN